MGHSSSTTVPALSDAGDNNAAFPGLPQEPHPWPPGYTASKHKTDPEEAMNGPRWVDGSSPSTRALRTRSEPPTIFQSCLWGAHEVKGDVLVNITEQNSFGLRTHVSVPTWDRTERHTQGQRILVLKMPWPALSAGATNTTTLTHP